MLQKWKSAAKLPQNQSTVDETSCKQIIVVLRPSQKRQAVMQSRSFLIRFVFDQVAKLKR